MAARPSIVSGEVKQPFQGSEDRIELLAAQADLVVIAIDVIINLEKDIVRLLTLAKG